ncbi:hypothetical protein [Methanoregula sp.]|nr:hypothetical protein [Methanoregula sp.]
MANGALYEEIILQGDYSLEGSMSGECYRSKDLKQEKINIFF